MTPADLGLELRRSRRAMIYNYYLFNLLMKTLILFRLVKMTLADLGLQ